MVAEAKQLEHEHPTVKSFFNKIMKDNVGFLASAVAWSVLTSIVPILVGLLAISGFVLRSPSQQAQVVSHLSQALQGVLSRSEIQHLVNVSIQHAGLLGLVGLLGVLWGGANVGGAISTVFQPIFQVSGRNFIKEKLIDMGMIFVFAFLMIVIVVGTSAGSVLSQLFSTVPLPPGIVQFVIGTALALAAAFLLFAIIYVVFPNADPGLKFRNVWPGALIAAVLFEILTYIFPLYETFAHFAKYGAMLGALLLLAAWIYFFALITIIGAEFVAFQALRDAEREGKQIGPLPNDSVPQRVGELREGNPADKASDKRVAAS